MTYVYQEYPKAIKGRDGEEITAKDAEEEAKLTGKSVAVLQKQAESNEEAALDEQENADARELEVLRDKGTDVTEDSLAKMTDLALKVGAAEPKKLGRPSNADKAAAAAKTEGK